MSKAVHSSKSALILLFFLLIGLALVVSNGFGNPVFLLSSLVLMTLGLGAFWCEKVAVGAIFWSLSLLVAFLSNC